MEMHMYLDGQLIDIVPIVSESTRIRVLQHLLEQRHRQALKSTRSRPLYSVEHVPSKVNNKGAGRWQQIFQ